MTITQQIRAIQSALGCVTDGKAGPQTWGAIYRKVALGEDAQGIESKHVSDMSVLDERSEKALIGCNPVLKSMARALVHEANALAPQFQVKVIEGFRTKERQGKLYEAYKAGGPKAAPPGKSKHEVGAAFDIGVFTEREYVPEHPLYREIGVIGERLGLKWGGRFGDEPHFELR